jgi:hypothetical protein
MNTILQYDFYKEDGIFQRDLSCGFLSTTTHPQQHIPNSTRVSSLKLDRQEKSATEVCVSSFDLVSLNLFWGNVSPTAPGALESEDLNASIAVVQVHRHYIAVC